MRPASEMRKLSDLSLEEKEKRLQDHVEGSKQHAHYIVYKSTLGSEIEAVAKRGEEFFEYTLLGPSYTNAWSAGIVAEEMHKLLTELGYVVVVRDISSSLCVQERKLIISW